jgi:ADP-ribose pyrophosphatase YjhB (NUDIX family)
MNNPKKYKLAIKWKDERCDVIHYNTSSFSHIPDHLIEKIHGVCFRDGKLLVVYHNEWNMWGIPGGTREKDEAIIETLKREIQEETACFMLSAEPLAYQEVKHSDGSVYYALYYYCNVEINGKFESDIAGTITKQEWINPEDFHNYIEEKPFRHAVIENALSLRKIKKDD